MDQSVLIEAIRLSKTHGRRILLDDVSLSVARGDLYALVGEAGSGKTALLRALVGLAITDTGSARIMGAESRGRAPTASSHALASCLPTHRCAEA